MNLRLDLHGAPLKALLAVYPNGLHSLAAIAAFAGFSQLETYYALRLLERHHILMQIADDAWALYSSLEPGPLRPRVLHPPGRGPPKPILPPIVVHKLSPLIRLLYSRSGLEPVLAPGERNLMKLTTAEIYFFRVLRRTAGVFLVLMRLNRPVGEAEIASVLDMSRKTIRAHLRSLAAINLVTRTHFHTGWTLTHAGRQMFLSPSPSPQPGKNYPVLKATTTAAVKNLNLKKDKDSESLTAAEEEAGGFKDSHEDRVKITQFEENDWGKFTQSENQDRGEITQSDELSTSHPQEDSTEPDLDDEVWQALLEAGITPNARTLRLAELEHITPEYIRAHHMGLQSANKGLQTGLLITILESGAPAPELNDRGHLTTCTCDACTRDRYLW